MRKLLFGTQHKDCRISHSQYQCADQHDMVASALCEIGNGCHSHHAAKYQVNRDWRNRRKIFHHKSRHDQQGKDQQEGEAIRQIVRDMGSVPPII